MNSAESNLTLRGSINKIIIFMLFPVIIAFIMVAISRISGVSYGAYIHRIQINEWAKVKFITNASLGVCGFFIWIYKGISIIPMYAKFRNNIFSCRGGEIFSFGERRCRLSDIFSVEVKKGIFQFEIIVLCRDGRGPVSLGNMVFVDGGWEVVYNFLKGKLI